MANEFNVTINNKTITLDKKTRILDLIEGDVHQYIVASVNNRLRDLNYEVFYDCNIELYTQKDYYAIKIYETSLRYIIAMACERAFPKLKIKFSYNISRSIYLTIHDEAKSKIKRFTERELKALKNEIDKIIAADYPLVRKVYSNEEAKQIYKQRGYTDKIAILKYRPEKTVHFYECDGYLNYMYGYTVPSTGHIKDYAMRIYGNGIIIQYPRSETNGLIPKFEEAPVFAETLRDSYLWAKLVGTNSIASINQYVQKVGTIEFINMCEQHHNDMLAELGDMIQKDSSSIRLICIAGPSSSGKTTFANRLMVELMARGLKPIRISIDDYYLSREEVPLDEEGKPDLECLEALDIDRFNDDMLRLIGGEEVTLPRYDFKLGYRVKGKTLKVGQDQPIIIEGIHALNDRLTSLIARHQKFKIFIAPQAQINIDNHNPISLTELRLLRRIVRDYKFRNASALETMSMWKSVRTGEFKWIYSTQENADYVYNSLLSYELCILKKYALPLLRAIDKDSEYGPMAERLIKFLKLFVDMDDKWVPCNSIMREFIGGSCFEGM